LTFHQFVRIDKANILYMYQEKDCKD